MKCALSLTPSTNKTWRRLSVASQHRMPGVFWCVQILVLLPSLGHAWHYATPITWEQIKFLYQCWQLSTIFVDTISHFPTVEKGPRNPATAASQTKWFSLNYYDFWLRMANLSTRVIRTWLLLGFPIADSAINTFDILIKRVWSVILTLHLGGELASALHVGTHMWLPLLMEWAQVLLQVVQLQKQANKN